MGRLFTSRVSLYLFAVLWLGPYDAFGQTATVNHNVNLRRDSSTDQAPIRLLKPPTKLQLLQNDPDDGYYNVRTAEGQEGWVWGKNVKIDLTESIPVAATAPAVTDSIPDDWDRPAPTGSAMSGPSGSCPFAGKGDEKDSNKRKNRTDTPTSFHDVTFDALSNLDYPTAAPKHRSDWNAAQLAIIERHEGVAVRVVGFLVALRPQTGNEEDTNCRFTKATETDWHMALVGKAGEGEKEAVVVETTPRIRKKHPNWTPSRLKDWVDSDQPVRISGWTFLDTEHRNHLNKYRQTLWEIHPILKIEVFKSGTWVNVDSLQ